MIEMMMVGQRMGVGPIIEDFSSYAALSLPATLFGGIVTPTYTHEQTKNSIIQIAADQTMQLKADGDYLSSRTAGMELDLSGTELQQSTGFEILYNLSADGTNAGVIYYSVNGRQHYLFLSTQANSVAQVRATAESIRFEVYGPKARAPTTLNIKSITPHFLPNWWE